MQTQLSLLERIQKIDIEVDEIRKENEKFPRARDIIAKEISELKSRIDSILAKKGEMEEHENALKSEVAQWDERIKRNEERIKEIKNDRQYRAVEKEINTARRKKAEIDREILKISDSLGLKNEELETLEERLMQKKEERDSLDAEMERLSREWKKTLENKRKERDKVTNMISPNILRRYELIREKRHGIGIAIARDGTCLGCHMNIPPQLYIQLMKDNDELIVCPHCHRILYIDNRI